MRFILQPRSESALIIWIQKWNRWICWEHERWVEASPNTLRTVQVVGSRVILRSDGIEVSLTLAMRSFGSHEGSVEFHVSSRHEARRPVRLMHGVRIISSTSRSRYTHIIQSMTELVEHGTRTHIQGFECIFAFV